MALNDHPDWCRCKSCEARDRLEEQAALVGVPMQDDPAVEAELGPVPEHLIEPSDLKREELERRMREEEPAERRALGYFP